MSGGVGERVVMAAVIAIGSRQVEGEDPGEGHAL